MQLQILPLDVLWRKSEKSGKKYICISVTDKKNVFPFHYSDSHLLSHWCKILGHIPNYCRERYVTRVSVRYD